LILEYYPKDVGAMTMNGAAYLRLLRRNFLEKYPSSDQIPVSQRSYLQYLAQNTQQWFSKAEALGWREETKDEADQYQQRIDRARQHEVLNH
jgi:hypothetical protein